MKKIIAILMVLGVALLSKADVSLTVTNSYPANSLLVGWSADMGVPLDLQEIYVNESYTFTVPTGGYLYAFDPEIETEGHWLVPTEIITDYWAVINDPAFAPTFGPYPVPEPTAISLFMLGFGTTFGTGMMANGARWLRNVVVGSSNE